MRARRAASSAAPTGASSRLLRIIAAIGLAVGLLQIPTPSVALDPADRDPIAGTTGTLAGSGGYPRVIRLAHAGTADGTIIETDTDAFTGGTQRFHRSTDGGRTFEPLPSLSITGVIHGTDLFELPADAGALSAGTLLFAAAVNPSGTYPAESGDTEMQIPVYRSDDGAETWTLLSYSHRTDTGAGTGGLWEPELNVADDGSLVCLYSDETDHPDHSQVLTQVTSSDGGATWSDPQVVVATPDPVDRPGMPTTARLGDGSWVMTYEDCGLRHAPCLVLIRTGPDGLHWGDPTADGTVVTATDGARFLSAPTVAWTPDGGPDGTVLVIGRVLNDERGIADPGNGRTVLASNHGAAGPWHKIPAPVATTPRWQDTPINYSSPLLPLGDGLVLGVAPAPPADHPTVRWGITSLTTLPTDVPPPEPAQTDPPPAPTPIPATATFTG